MGFPGGAQIQGPNPQNGGPKWGPKPHSYNGGSDGRQCDLAHITLPRGPSKWGPKPGSGDPILEPPRSRWNGQNHIDGRLNHQSNYGIWAPFWDPILGVSPEQGSQIWTLF